MNIEGIFELFGNYFFPMALSIYLIYRIDKIMTQIVQNQNNFHIVVGKELKAIKKDIHKIRLDMAGRS